MERFWAKVDVTDGCWLWLACVDGWGYGRFVIDRHVFKAHRLSYEWLVGPIPEGALVLHHCDTPRCVRPDHLFLGTPHHNTQDMIAKGRKAVLRGERHAMAKLTDAQVAEIRQRYATGEKQVALAEEFGVYQSHISQLVLRKQRR